MRPPVELDWSVREQILHAQDRPPAPNMGSTWLEVREEDDGYTVALPPPGLKANLLLFVLPAGVGVSVAFMFRSAGAGPVLASVIALMFALPIVGTIFWAVHRGVTRTELRVTPETLTLTRRTPWSCFTRATPCEEIEELAVADPASGGPGRLTPGEGPVS